MNFTTGPLVMRLNRRPWRALGSSYSAQSAKMRVPEASPIFGGEENIIWHACSRERGTMTRFLRMQKCLADLDYIIRLCVATMQPNIKAKFDITFGSHVQV